ARRVAAAGVLLAAAAAALVWWRLPARRGGDAPAATPPPAPIALHRGRVLDHDGARFLHASAQPDEVVRLVDGALTVEVDPLAAGERFRVVTGDAEVEVIGTAFDVVAEEDALRRVRVLHGRVAVRVTGAQEVVLTAGQSWAWTPPAPADVPGPAPAPPAARMESMRRDAGTSRTAVRGAAQQAYDDGWQAIRAGEFDRAAAAFERAMSADGGRARVAEDAHYWRAVALARAGRAERAAAVFDSFIAAHPGSPRAGEVSAMLGWILYERGEHSAAALRFRAAVGDPSPRVRQSATQGLEALRKAGH
ncbi:MAG TPA: tetratricopeptide repeat protein, partial [Kofleriaceae bacterium]|nr:tetratricopeptide repeat protein [Kofleriaceae bacterium]